MSKKNIKKESRLVTSIRQDDTLRLEDNEKYLLFIALADEYTSDLAGNLLLNSIQLEDKYAQTTSSDQWQDFLAYPIVNKYRERYVDEQAQARANVEIIEGDKMNQALAVRDNIANRKGDNNRFNFVVFRLPARGDVDDSKSI